eukprot:6203135-Pleurochrysis_carterae.AAC.1
MRASADQRMVIKSDGISPESSSAPQHRDGIVNYSSAYSNVVRKKGAKTQRGAGGPKDCECGQGAREAKWEGHRWV